MTISIDRGLKGIVVNGIQFYKDWLTFKYSLQAKMSRNFKNGHKSLNILILLTRIHLKKTFL